MLADQGNNLLHQVVCRQNERYTHDGISAPEFANELPPRRVLEHHSRGLEILGEVFQRELGVKGAGAKQTLGAGHLFVEQLVADTRGIAMTDSQWTANACQQDSPCGLAIRDLAL
jgi:hypothetical protein